MLSARTTLTQKDLTAGSIALLWRARDFWIGWGMWTILIGGFIAYSKGIPASPRNWLALGAGAIVGALVSQVVIVGVGLWRSVRSLRKTDGVLGDHEYELRDEGFFERTNANETLARWNSVKSLRRARGFIFVEVPRGAFHLISEKSFPTAAEADSFWVALQAHVQRAT